MSRIFPFRAFRYSAAPGHLKTLLCPPYDVIGEAQEKQLRRDPHNAIAVELPKGSDAAKYGSARKIWDSWKAKGVVSRDSDPAFYVYEQVFKAHGKTLSRKGFFCELRVEEPGKGSVLRHEYTLSGPKADRLNLIRATRINTSPIFGLFRDSRKSVAQVFKAVCKRKPAAQVKDPEGVTHRLWLCTDSKQIQTIQAAVKSVPVLIADGHHRYETSWNYRKEMKAKRGSENMLFFICPMDDPGLVIEPTHRISKDPDHLGLSDLLARVEKHKAVFSVQPCALSSFDPHHPKGVSFVITDGKKAYAVRVKSSAEVKKRLSGKPKAYLDLPLAHLHAILVPDLKKEDFTYVHELKEALALTRKKKTAAVLVPATTTQELYGVVSAGEVMPQKSTYFYPKIITGLLFRSLD